MSGVTRLLAALCVLLALATAANAATTLETVRARGKVVCGAADPLPGFAQQNGNGLWSGFDVDFCRAVAAAVFADPNKVEFLPLTGSARFALLQTDAIDLLARDAAWTMHRDSGYGASYVGASFFDGQAFLVQQSLNVVSAYELAKVRVCVLDGGDDVLNVRDFFFQSQTPYTEVLYEDRQDLTVAYQAGLCDAVSANASWLYAMKRALPDSGDAPDSARAHLQGRVRSGGPRRRRPVVQHRPLDGCSR